MPSLVPSVKKKKRTYLNHEQVCPVQDLTYANEAECLCFTSLLKGTKCNIEEKSTNPTYSETEKKETYNIFIIIIIPFYPKVFLSPNNPL